MPTLKDWVWLLRLAGGIIAISFFTTGVGIAAEFPAHLIQVASKKIQPQSNTILNSSSQQRFVCPITPLQYDFWKGSGPVAGEYPVWIWSLGRYGWSEIVTVRSDIAKSLGFSKASMGVKNQLYVDQDATGELRVTGRQLDGNGIVYFPILDELQENSDGTRQLISIPSTVFVIHDVEQPQISAPSGKVAHYWWYLLPQPGCYEFTFIVDGRTVKVVQEFLKNSDLLVATPLFDAKKYQLTTQTLDSPDGQWTAEVLSAIPNQSLPNSSNDYYQQLTVINMDGSQRLVPIRMWSPFGLGWDALRLERWSKDGRYIYFTNVRFGDGCGVFNSGSNLQRFDITDNTINRILFGEQWATFSPNEQDVAYFRDGVLVIEDLMTHEQQQTDVTLGPQSLGGKITWSPDGLRIAYTIANQPCVNGWTDSTTLIVVDTKTMTHSELLPSDKRRLVTEMWYPLNSLIVTDIDTGKYFSVDIKTSQIKALNSKPKQD